jgi:hypothetical protein
MMSSKQSGFAFFQRVLHAAAFELEHGDRLRLLQRGINCGIVQRQAGNVERHLAGDGTSRVDRLDRPVDDRQRAQAEEVELDQADGFDVILVELGDDAIVAAFAVERGEIGQRFRRDHDNRRHACRRCASALRARARGRAES